MKRYGLCGIVMMVVVGLFTLAPVGVWAKPVSPDFVELAKRLNPSVVNIRTAKVSKPRASVGRRAPNPFGGDFFDFFAPLKNHMK